MTEHAPAGPAPAAGDGGVRREPWRVAVACGTEGAERIATMVPDECAAFLRAPDRTDDVDLWIADESALDRAGGALPTDDGAPVLLVVDDDRLSAERWSEIGDIVVRPLRPAVVRRRIENLLGTLEPRTGRTAESRAERVGIDCVTHPVVTARVDDGDRIVRAVNPAFEEAFGFDADAVVGERLSEWLVPPDARENARELVRRASEGAPVERLVRRETATGRRDVVVKMFPTDGADADLLVCYEDVTGERCRKQQVQVLNRVLRHNLRNGMNVILGNAEMLADRVDDPDAAEAARSIADAARDLVDLGETASSLRTTWEGPDRRIVDAVCVVDRVRTELRRGSPKPDVRVEAPESCPVFADAHLDTAIRELCENAIEYAVDDGDPVVVGVSRDGDWTEISVSDRGPGLPRTERAVLRGDEETPLEHGNGLGLWIVNWIVTSLGGEISVEDNEPTGTTVTLSLPSGPRRSDRPPEGDAR